MCVSNMFKTGSASNLTPKLNIEMKYERFRGSTTFHKPYKCNRTNNTHLNTNLIASSLGNVPNPTICMIPTLIIHSQKPHMNSRSRKHRYLKLNVDRWSNPCFRTDSSHQLQIDCQHAFGLSRESFDSPYNCILFRLVFGTSKGGLNL